MIFYYRGTPCNLKISATPEMITAIEFTTACTPGRKNIPYSAQLLVEWLDGYSEKKTGTSLCIKFSVNGQPHEPEKNKKTILLDASSYTGKELLVYEELVKIPAGMKISYGGLAEKCGIKGGARFIGNAMAKNRFPVIVPCHRVIKSDGSTGNFSGGEGVKELLLAHEAGGFSPLR